MLAEGLRSCSVFSIVLVELADMRLQTTGNAGD